MDHLGILAQLEAKPGKEQEVADFLKSPRQLALQETGTSNWFAFKTGPTTFGIFDTFADDDGCKAHLTGELRRRSLRKQKNSPRVRPQLHMA